jgi:hypothetical protein
MTSWVRRVFSAAGLALVLACPASSQNQAVPPEAFLSSFLGRWEYVVRTPDGIATAPGTRTFTRVSTDTLAWVDQHADGGVSEGQLRFDRSRQEFEYSFPGANGGCFVRGRLAGGTTIRFGRDGPCHDEVLESVLTVQNPASHSYTYANGVLAIDFARAP